MRVTYTGRNAMSLKAAPIVGGSYSYSSFRTVVTISSYGVAFHNESAASLILCVTFVTKVSYCANWHDRLAC